jgi:hypothetical protein
MLRVGNFCHDTGLSCLPQKACQCTVHKLVRITAHSINRQIFRVDTTI